jgi:hypothetical protein
MYTYTTPKATDAQHAPVEPFVKRKPHPFSNFASDFGWKKRGEIKQLPQLYEKAAV